MKTISLRDANQGFAKCVRAVEAGEEFVITRNGTPVARLVPVADRRVLTADQQAALARVREQRAEGWVIDAGPFNRDSLHDD